MKRISTLILAAAALAAPACASEGSLQGDDDDGTPGGPNDPTNGNDDEWEKLLSSREADYSAALRIAALKLTGDLPSMTEINQVASAPDAAAKKAAYSTLVDAYLERPTFRRQMFKFWQDTFKLGGAQGSNLNAAPAFAAQLTVADGNYMELLTRGSNNCPTVNLGDYTFANGECANGGPKAGVLSDPGMNASYAGNLAFRRVRWVQETFDCVKFPAELGTTPQDVGGAQPYLGVWPFTTIASPKNGGGRVDFQDVSAAVCANCHQTLNRIAPLFGNYNATGVYGNAIAVPVPLEGAPIAQLNDWLPPGETTAWRLGAAAATLPELGAAMAADADVAKCAVARIWNFAMSKQDIVDALQEVPAATIQGDLDAFVQSGFKIKSLIRSVFNHEDFYKF